MIDAFEGNRAETKTMILLVQRFVAAHVIAGGDGGRRRWHDE